MRYIKIKFSDGKVRKVPFLEPMRPIETKEIPDDYTGWIAEEKVDGSLTLMYLVDGAVAYVNRRGTNKTFVYPELIDDEPRKFNTKGLTIIQGETYALGGGTDSFEAFLKRDLLQDPEEAKNRQRQYPLKFRAFDILMKDNKWVKDKPILERKKILKALVPKGTEIEVSPYSTNPREFTKELKRDKTVEGVVFKKLPDGYEEGKSKKWRKLKFKKEADVVVMGYEKGQGRRKDIGALKVGIYDKGKVKEVANVGTGFTDEELAQLKRRLDKGEKVFGKVEYMKVGSQGRLRAPVWVGERKDITVKETHL
jgi:bifunctional non-homologous end joining protein LigD